VGGPIGLHPGALRPIDAASRSREQCIRPARTLDRLGVGVEGELGGSAGGIGAERNVERCCAAAAPARHGKCVGTDVLGDQCAGVANPDVEVRDCVRKSDGGVTSAGDDVEAGGDFAFVGE
jgi:hypothetical protein